MTDSVAESRNEKGLKMEEEPSEYCVATYIRQNSANFERLNSLTESVCHSEEERKLMDKKANKCYCSKTEYCSSECKEADRNRNYASTQNSTKHSTHKAIKFHRQNSAPQCSSCSKTSDKTKKSDKKKERKEVRIDLTPISSTDSVASDKHKNNSLSLFKIIIIILVTVGLTFLLTMLLCKLFLWPSSSLDAGDRAEHQYGVHSGETKQKLYTTEVNVTSSWLSLNLDQKRFYKGDDHLRWAPIEESSEITLTEDDCLELKRSALYEIVSKITFEIWPNNKTSSTYHNVQLKNEWKILDKNVITLLPAVLREQRMLKTSLVLVLREFKAGDVICVNVHDTSLVYVSTIDNSLNIIQKV